MYIRPLSFGITLGLAGLTFATLSNAANLSDVANIRSQADLLLQPASVQLLDQEADSTGNLSQFGAASGLRVKKPFHPNDLVGFDALLAWVTESDKPSNTVTGKQMFLPLQRPYPALALSGDPVAIEVPKGRPDIEELLPAATLTLADFATREAALSVAEEAVFTLQKGETLAKLLKRAGMTSAEQYPLVQELTRKVNPRRLQIGMQFTIGKSADGDVTALQVELKNAMSYYLMKTESLGWFGLQAIRPVDTLLVEASAVIEGTLYDTMQAANVPVAALEEFVRVMGFTVDFQRQLRKGDSFGLIYERTVDRLTGAELSAGKLHYASMNLSGEPLHFFRHDHLNGQVGWYDETGASAVRTLMRTPVSGARVSSNYGMRKHPTLGYNAMHRGVDFAVPTGTPIVAAGTGRVEAAGWNGSYGRYIRIRHSGTYKTAYAHMSRIASGIRPGTNVRQGQVIGFVGSSGRSTGPHLHYEIIVNNRKVNPMTIKLPTGKGLEGFELQRYQDRLTELAAYLGPDQQINFAERTQ